MFCYKYVYFVLPKKIPHFLQKNVFFKRKHDFSRKMEGGTGLQGVFFQPQSILKTIETG